jgi:hypothetical protein
MQSLIANNAKDAGGTGLGGPVGPKSRTKAWSLTKHSPIFAVLEAANFSPPEVTRVLGLLETVEVMVSSVLAVR